MDPASLLAATLTPDLATFQKTLLSAKPHALSQIGHVLAQKQRFSLNQNCDTVPDGCS